MDFEDLLLNHLSRRFVDHIVQSISENPVLFDKLFPLLFADKERLAWRTGWVLCHLQEKMPHLLEAKQTDLLDLVFRTPFHGVRRSILYLISNMQCKEYSVEFINACFDWMLSPKQAPAIQLYSMYCLEKVCVLYPDFKPELLACLENMEPQDYSKGFNGARLKMIKKLQKPFSEKRRHPSS